MASDMHCISSMDPNTTYALYLDGSDEAALDLAQWLNNDGFEPKWTADEKAEFWDYVGLLVECEVGELSFVTNPNPQPIQPTSIDDLLSLAAHESKKRELIERYRNLSMDFVNGHGRLTDAELLLLDKRIADVRKQLLAIWVPRTWNH